MRILLNDLIKHKPKIAWITGASNGMGQATAKKFAKVGYIVGVNYLSDASGAEKTVNEIKQFGVNAVAIQGDVGDSADLGRIFEELNQLLGRLDVLVTTPHVVLGLVKVLKTLICSRLNVFSAQIPQVFLICQLAIRIMKQKSSGLWLHSPLRPFDLEAVKCLIWQPLRRQ